MGIARLSHPTAKVTRSAKAFDPNVLETGEVGSGYATNWPTSIGDMPVPMGPVSAADYASAFMSLGDLSKSDPGLFEVAKMGVAGAVDAPEMQSFARMSIMPNAFQRGMVQWPGFPGATLKKIARDHYIVSTIIQQRVADIMRYATLSSHPWKPGWAIEMRNGFTSASKSDLQDIQDAQRFVLNCNSEFGWDARQRDQAQLTGFANFLAATTRDTYTYDGIAWWTDMDASRGGGKVRAFKALPASNIMLCTRDGYEGRKEVFACGVDEAGSVTHQFTRRELTWVTRNKRTDAEVWDYGFPEIEMSVRLIEGFSNAFNMNADIFTRDAVPRGLLKLKGMFNQRQVEVMSRIWSNLNKGPKKKLVLPAIPIPKDGDIELLDFSRMEGNDAYYQDYVNMVAGLFCAIYAFPVNRLGYRISGKGNPSEQKDAQSPAVLIDEADSGLPVLLNTIETAFNSYILWTRWPHLQLAFRGKNPKEDAREYDARKDASTYGEMRALSDLPTVESMAPDELKPLARLIDLAPMSPNLAGIWQNASAAWLKATLGDGGGKDGDKSPEGVVRDQHDPAAVEDHGHVGGVRRNSAAEEANAEASDS